tara:strand:+ start:229 stop:669 length:441 start_codon:yes stop_codon:yes gene_type:complete
MNCYLCNEKIYSYNNIYKGFDCTFCSKYCRDKVIKEIYNKETSELTMNELWQENNRKKDLYIWTVDPNLKKKKSIKDLNSLDTTNSDKNSTEYYDFQYCNDTSEISSEYLTIQTNKRTCNYIYSISLENIKEYFNSAFHYTITYFT